MTNNNEPRGIVLFGSSRVTYSVCDKYIFIIVGFPMNYHHSSVFCNMVVILTSYTLELRNNALKYIGSEYS